MNLTECKDTIMSTVESIIRVAERNKSIEMIEASTERIYEALKLGNITEDQFKKYMRVLSPAAARLRKRR